MENTVIFYGHDEMKKRLQKLFDRIDGSEKGKEAFLSDLLNLAGEKMPAKKFQTGILGLLRTYAKNQDINVTMLLMFLEDFFDGMVQSADNICEARTFSVI